MESKELKNRAWNNNLTMHLILNAILNEDFHLKDLALNKRQSSHNKTPVLKEAYNTIFSYILLKFNVAKLSNNRQKYAIYEMYYFISYFLFEF